MSSQAAQQPSPQLFFQTINAYQRTEALKAAIELGVFTAIGKGKFNATQLANTCKTSERGMRILCDFLCIIGFLNKEGSLYSNTQDSAIFLDKNSPAYLGSVTEFISSDAIVGAFRNFAEAVRRGGTTMPDEGTVTPDSPVWVSFARAMAPMMAMPAQHLARLVDSEPNQQLKVLDIAAGHGLYGIAFASNNEQAEIVALDWKNVLTVAKENAEKAGVGSRYSTIEGNAFDVDYGAGYDIVLLTNILHHFDVPTNEGLLRKIHAALKEGGRAVTVEFVPNEDRITPPDVASFSVQMLGGTPAGDAYTFAEFEKMFANAGFKRSEIQPLPASIEQVIISYK